MNYLLFTDGHNFRVVLKGTNVDKTNLARQWGCPMREITFFVCSFVGDTFTPSEQNLEQFKNPRHGLKTEEKWDAVKAPASAEAVKLADANPKSDVDVVTELQARIKELENQLLDACELNQSLVDKLVQLGQTAETAFVVEVEDTVGESGDTQDVASAASVVETQATPVRPSTYATAAAV